ncbi:MAG: hypothetical protein MI892_29670 [Desulfobacterales bacterium]|nr:hypothetical protein [Desulfobacterales bacterium]
MKIQSTDPNTIHSQTQVRFSNAPEKPSFNHVLSDAMATSPKSHSSGNGLIEIGTITRDTPTISQLLFKTPLKDKCWNIIYDKVNADKPFNKIRPGTTIVYDPQSKELLWGKDLKQAIAAKCQNSTPLVSHQRMPGESAAQVNDTAGDDLSKAVKQFIGKDYDSMDCYELVVGGLRQLGVQYKGKGGLGQHLISQALSKGLPQNHYLNGEGLVSESGRQVFKKTLYSVKNPEIQADSLMTEMMPLLKEGQVLSFSMRSKGHTGVVSKAMDQWTFINSGDMDNAISGKNGDKRVGEEYLKSELENWLSMARDAGQGLKITLGDLNLDRLSMFANKKVSKKV